MGKRLTYEFVKESFEKEGYKLLSKEYVSAHCKLKYRCPKGHGHNIEWANWSQGQRCPYCVNLGKPTIEFIKTEFKKEGYELLSKEYTNAHQKLEYICLNRHRHSISWNNWKGGYRCPYCYEQCKPIIEFIRFEFEKEKCVLLTKEYKNNRQKLEYICSRGHKHNICWASWKRGSRCRHCDKRKIPIEHIKSQFEKEFYILLSNEYINAKQKLEYICPKGHQHGITWDNWKQGNRCPYCVIIASKGEIEVRGFVESLGI